ncbi:MAG TPA: hypothetical protein VG714_07555 [Acidobacteriaceae bacterium]|nr:hypothetical protein [Acidobacteriaceae bacterium]
MKTIVRSFVIVLALTGAVATTATTSSASAKTTIAASKTSAMPVPTCPLNSPTGCGIGTW